MAFVLMLFAAIYRIVLNLNLFRTDENGALNLVSLTVILSSTLFFLYCFFDAMFIRSAFMHSLFINALWVVGALLAADLTGSIVQAVRGFRSDYGTRFKVLRCVSLLLFAAVVMLAVNAAVGTAPL